MVRRMTSLTWASDSERSMASPMASAMMCIVAFSSSVHSRSLTQSLTASVPHRWPCANTDTDRNDLMCCFSKSVRRKPVEVARVAGEDLALPLVLRDPLQQRIGIDDRLHDHRRRGQFAAEAWVDPVGGDRLGEALAGHFAQPEQDAALAVRGRAQRFQDGFASRAASRRPRAAGARRARPPSPRSAWRRRSFAVDARQAWVVDHAQSRAMPAVTPDRPCSVPSPVGSEKI